MTTNSREATPEPEYTFTIAYKAGEDAPPTPFAVKTYVIAPNTPKKMKPYTSSTTSRRTIPIVFVCAECNGFRLARSYRTHDNLGNYYCNMCN